MAERPLPGPILQNVVASASFGAKLDLNQVARNSKHVTYNPQRFAAAILGLAEPKSKALLFASGKVVLTGAKDEGLAKVAARKALKILLHCGYSAAKLSACSLFVLLCSYSPSFPGTPTIGVYHRPCKIPTDFFPLFYA